MAHLLERHLAHLRSPETIAPPRSVRRPRTAGSRRLWAAALVVPAALILALLTWGVVHMLTPKGDANPGESKGDFPKVQAPHGRAGQRPVPPIGGDAYFQKVWADLHDDDYFTRKAAVERLTNMKPNDQRANVLPKLIELMEDQSPFIRGPAIKALGAWGTKEEVPVLSRALAHKEPSTRREALKAIGHFQDPRTLEPVMHCFRDPSTRREAGDALREMGPLGEPDVLALLNERDETGGVFLKRDAIGVLADIGSEKSLPALRRASASGSIHLVEPARKALAAIAERQQP